MDEWMDGFQRSQELLEIIYKNVCAWALGYCSGVKEVHSDSLETLVTNKEIKGLVPFYRIC